MSIKLHCANVGLGETLKINDIVDVTSNRLRNVIYTNETDSPIFVTIINIEGTVGYKTQIRKKGTEIWLEVGRATAAGTMTISFIVPKNYEYQSQFSEIGQWLESQ